MSLLPQDAYWRIRHGQRGHCYRTKEAIIHNRNCRMAFMFQRDTIDVQGAGDCIARSSPGTTFRYHRVHELLCGKLLHALMRVLGYVSLRFSCKFAVISLGMGAHARYAMN